MSKKAKKQLSAAEIQAKKEAFEKALNETREKVNAMSDKEKMEYCYCWKHDGKMTGLVSMSTSSKYNLDCILRIEAAKKLLEETGKEMICLHCFSEAMQDRYSTMYIKYIVATEILTSKVFDIEDFPLLNVSIARKESFGDINPVNNGGINQGLNYIHDCKRNPDTMFSCWTKNPYTWKMVFEIEAKPENLIMIYSDPVINGSMQDPEALLFAIQCIFPFIDKIFIVYDKEYIKNHNVSINCGALSCNSCRRCYRKYTESVIKEILK